MGYPEYRYLCAPALHELHNLPGFFHYYFGQEGPKTLKVGSGTFKDFYRLIAFLMNVMCAFKNE